MTGPKPEITAGKFRFVNGTTHNYNVRWATTDEGTPPTNTANLPPDGNTIQGGDVGAVPVTSIPAGKDIHLFVQDTGNENLWYHGIHANHDNADGGMFVIDQMAGWAGEIVLNTLDGNGMMADGMGLSPMQPGQQPPPIGQ